MYLRNPLRLAETHELHKSLVAFYSQLSEFPEEVEINGIVRKLGSSDWLAYRSADEDEIKRMWLHEVGAAAWLAKMMMGMRWAIEFSETPTFITTDNPVIVLHPSLRFRGFKDPETTVMFPLSPTRVLLMDNRHSEPDGHYYPVNDCTPIVNGLLWRDAIDRMFSSRHPDYVCAEIVLDAERRGYA